MVTKRPAPNVGRRLGELFPVHGRLGRGLGGDPGNLVQLGPQLAARFFQLVIVLQTHLEAGRGAEVAGQPQGRVGGHGPFALDDLVDPTGRHVDGAGQAVLTDS